MYSIYLLLLLNLQIVFCQKDQCVTDSMSCHYAASCINETIGNKCKCDEWYIGNGEECYGYCDYACSSAGHCAQNEFGYTCLCSASKSNCSELAIPQNIAITWTSSTALAFSWSSVPNAYNYRAILRNSTWTSLTAYITVVSMAAFDDLKPNSLYTLVLFAKGFDGFMRSGIASIVAYTDSLQPAEPSANLSLLPSSTTARRNHSVISSNKCGIKFQICHPQAKCRNTSQGFQCVCNEFYVGNGTYCVGVCDTSHCRYKENKKCFSNAFGYTCVCNPGRGIRCKSPSPPSQIRVLFQTTNSLVFGWNHVTDAVSYRAKLTGVTVKSYSILNYISKIPQAAFTNLVPGSVYRVSVQSYGLKRTTTRMASLTTSTVIANGPPLTSKEINSTSFAISVSKPPFAVSCDVEYFTDPKTITRKTFVTNTTLITGLSQNRLYDVIVYVNYEAGRSNGSAPISVHTGSGCDLMPEKCHANAACSNLTVTCKCLEGFSGNGKNCTKIYGLEFHQKMASFPVSRTAVSIELRQAYQINRSDVINIHITHFGSMVSFLVYTDNEHLKLHKPQDREFPLLAEEPISLVYICPTTEISGYNFTEISAGSIQTSLQQCSNGQAIATINCDLEKVETDKATLLRSRFNESSLIIKKCRRLPTSSTVIIKKPSQNETIYVSKVVEVVVPDEAINAALAQLNMSSITANVTIHEGDDLFPSTYDVKFVISIDIGINTTIENLQNPVQLVMTKENTSYGQITQINPLLNKQVFQRCVFWDEEASDWSSKGCCLSNSLTPPTCKCSHLSSFALIVSTTDIPANIVLSTISDIGCVLSVIGLAATFLTISLNKQLRRKLSNKIQLHLSCNLSITYLIFLLGISRTENYALCTAITALLQYFFLVSWIWMAVYSNRLYVALVQVFKATGEHFLLQTSALAYCLPAVIVATNLIITVGYFDQIELNKELCIPEDRVTRVSYYRAENMCWLTGNSLYFGFLLFVGAVLLYNSIVLVSVVVHIRKKKNIRSTRSRRSKLADAVSAICLSFVLGLAWMFGFFMLLSTEPTYNLVLNWIFAIFNAFQGFIIWYINCVKRTDQRKYWWPPIKALFLLVLRRGHCYKDNNAMNNCELSSMQTVSSTFVKRSMSESRNCTTYRNANVKGLVKRSHSSSGT